MHLGHVAVHVTDLDRALTFYCGTLGLTEGFRLTNDAGEPWLVYVLVDERSSIELFPGGDAAPAERPRYGNVHICLLVDDIHATVEDLRRRGLHLEGAPTLGLDGNYQYWLKDPDGNPIELMQIMPESLQMKAVREKLR